MFVLLSKYLPVSYTHLDVYKRQGQTPHTYKSNLQDIFRVKCSVNGQLRQDGGTNLMLHPLHKILQHISTMISLEPGDIILTGTPAGVDVRAPVNSFEFQPCGRTPQVDYLLC